jgi:hypothetical protein
MLIDLLTLAGLLLGTTICCYGTYDKIKTGRAAFGNAGSLYVDSEKNPLAYKVSVFWGCVFSAIFIGLTLWFLYSRLQSI